MSRQRRARSVSVWWALAGVLVGCGGDPAPEAPDPADWGTGIVLHAGPASAEVTGPKVATAQALAAGQWDSPQQMYQATCGGCHGAGVGPHILGQGLPAAYIQYIGRNGLRAMPPFRVTDYTDAELATLATWINAQPAALGAPTPITPKAPVQLPNAVANGSSPDAIYTGMCSSCHDNGAPPLRGRALLDGYVKVVVRHGVRSMPAFPAASITDADLTALVTWLNEQPRRAP